MKRNKIGIIFSLSMFKAAKQIYSEICKYRFVVLLFWYNYINIFILLNILNKIIIRELRSREHEYNKLEKHSTSITFLGLYSIMVVLILQILSNE